MERAGDEASRLTTDKVNGIADNRKVAGFGRKSRSCVLSVYDI